MNLDDDMFRRTETVVVAANELTRAGLSSLVEKYAYRIVASAESVEKLLHSPPQEAPKLLLLAADGADGLASQASTCRRAWPDLRIVTMYDCTRPGDEERVCASTVNGCVATSVSERALLRLLDLVMREDNDLFLLVQVRSGPEDRNGRKAPVPHPDQARADKDAERPQSSSPDTGPRHSGNGETALVEQPPIREELPIVPTENGRGTPRLSERELQVLDGIVRGLQNKMIARTYGITEATVKVHMKSILRKIQVHNRTQAAVWAMGHNISITNLEARLFHADMEGEHP